ncbi:unannotated protein [freshwater metagenome]|uniref:Unannotated protein n=1 Tax=freshwater metagenome TaxID=449393 RepID=A0A6J7E6K2_9ZZZZ
MPLTLGSFNLPTGLGHPTKVSFKNLSHVHTARNTQGVQDNVNRSSISQERHVFGWQDLGDNTLVAVAASKLVTVLDLALLRDVHANQLVHPWRKFITVLVIENANVDDLAGLTVWNLERSIPNFASLLTKDGTQQTLFRGQLSFTLRCDLANQNITWNNFGTDANNATLVEVLEDFFRHVWNVSSNFLWAQLGVARIDFVFLNVN